MRVHSTINGLKRIRDDIGNEHDCCIINDAIEMLEDYEHVSERLYAEMRDNYSLKNRVGLLTGKVRKLEGND